MRASPITILGDRHRTAGGPVPPRRRTGFRTAQTRTAAATSAVEPGNTTACGIAR
jgi:hypothetical protein